MICSIADMTICHRKSDNGYGLRRPFGSISREHIAQWPPNQLEMRRLGNEPSFHALGDGPTDGANPEIVGVGYK